MAIKKVTKVVVKRVKKPTHQATYYLVTEKSWFTFSAVSLHPTREGAEKQAAKMNDNNYKSFTHFIVEPVGLSTL